MRGILAGGAAAMLVTAGGLFWWQGHAGSAPKAAPAHFAAAPVVEEALPEGDDNAFGAAPPMPASASTATREQRRFARYDRNKDGVITRLEMMSSRTKAFKKLDKDGNNLLSFEEWAAGTADKFDTADANHDDKLTPAEFATTAPKHKAKPRCGC